MKKVVSIIFFLFLVNNIIAGDFKYIWNKNFDIASDDEGISIIKDQDNNYAIISYSDRFAYILKINEEGDSLYSKKLFPQFYPSDITFTYDGGYIVIGTENVSPPAPLIILKTDSFGDTIWVKKIYPDFSAGVNHGTKIIHTSDGNYLISGRKNHYDEGGEAWLIKITTNGDTLWTRELGTTGLNDVSETTNGGFIAVGYRFVSWTTHMQFKLHDFLLIKTDSGGALEWQKAIEGAHYTNAGDDVVDVVTQTNDGEFIFVGRSKTWKEMYEGFGNTRMVIFRITENGDTIWTKELSQNFKGSACNIFQLDDGNTIIVSNDGWFIKIDSLGTLQSSNHFGGQISKAVMSDTDEYVFCGMTNSYSEEGSDIWVCKINENPTSIENTLSENFILHQNFPNPFNPKTTIIYNLNSINNVKLNIYDISGRLVKTILNETQSAGKHSVSLDASEWASGVYIYKLKTDLSEQCRKMLLVK